MLERGQPRALPGDRNLERCAGNRPCGRSRRCDDVSAGAEDRLQKPALQPGRLQESDVLADVHGERALVRRLFKAGRFVAVCVPIGVLAIVIGAYAYWTAIGVGSASGAVSGLTSPSPSASSPTYGTAHLSWSAVTLNPSVPAVDSEVAFTVERKLSSGSSWTFVCGTGTTPKPYNVLSCDDLPPATADYDYRVVAHFRSWTSAGTASVHVVVDTVK